MFPLCVGMRVLVTEGEEEEDDGSQAQIYRHFLTEFRLTLLLLDVIEVFYEDENGSKKDGEYVNGVGNGW